MTTTATTWTCARCDVTASWMPGVERPEIPPGWAQDNGHAHCLICRRELAAEQALAAAGDVPATERQKLQASARVEFEIGRDPDRGDGEIAKACSSSIAAVKKARERLSA